MVRKSQLSTTNLVILIIIIGIIVILALSNIPVSKGKCEIKEPFTCKELKIVTGATVDSGNYILLTADNIEDVKVIPESVNAGQCNTAYVDRASFDSSQHKDVKIILECPEESEEIVAGSLELLYRTSNGEVRKNELEFSQKVIKNILEVVVQSFKNEIVASEVIKFKDLN